VTLNLDFAQDNLLDELVEKIHAGGATLEIRWNDKPLGPPLELTGADTVEQPVPAVLLRGQYKLPVYQPGCFVPRRRVLKADTFLKLLETYFEDFVQWENSVATALNAVRFPDAKRTSHVQDGLTDYEMLERLVACYNHMESPGNALALSGGAGEKRQLTWLQEQKYAELNLRPGRKLDDLVGADIIPLVKLNRSRAGAPALFKQPTPATLVTYVLNWGNLDPAKWDPWYRKDVPAFYRDKFVHEITDSLSWTGDERLSWESYVSVLPAHTLTGAPASALTPWSRTGTITQRSPRSQWLRAKLAGFEEGHDEVDVRLTTPYSGKGGDNGLHLLPEEGTEVWLVKGSCWQEPVLLAANVRGAEVVHEAPFWKLEDKSQWQFADHTLLARSQAMTHEADLTVNARNIRTTSEQHTETQAADVVVSASGAVSIAATKDVSISASKDVSISATKDVGISATNDANLSALNINTTSTLTTAINALDLTAAATNSADLSATAGFKISGATVDVAALAEFNASAMLLKLNC
jgi:hypothetical protein